MFISILFDYTTNCLLFYCQSLVYPDNEIAEDVHIVDEGLVWSVVRVESLMDLSVGEELCTHIIKVVAFLKVPEVCPEGTVINDGKLLGKRIQFVESVLLELVSKQSGQVPFLVRPRNGLRNGKGRYRLEL